MRRKCKISTDEDRELSKIKNARRGVSIPRLPNNKGNKIEMMTNGAIEIRIYLDLDSSSSV
jgi:hypothetical protein